VALIGETTVVSDLGERERGIKQQLFGVFDAEGPKPSVRGHTRRMSKSPNKATRRHMTRRGDVSY